MKKNVFLLLIGVVLVYIGVAICKTSNIEDIINVDTEASVIKHENSLSMMLETEANSGNYEMTTGSEWPTEGYVFNTELSKCENGGKLSWDDTNKRVVMNGNKSDKCYVYFDKYNPITINNYSITSNGNSITITIDATAGTGTIAKYLYSKDNGVSYVQSANNTYTFTGLNNETYNIKAYVQDSNGKNSEIISKTIEIISITLADYVKSLYTGTQGENNIYYHTSTLTNGAGDNSYRYAGANPNNYVCFGSTATSCPTDNLYRIIGVFGDKVGENQTEQRVKLIKSTSVGNKAWDSNNKNTWSTSSLNTYLNNEFINIFDETTKGNIADTTWKVGGNTWKNIAEQPAKTAYQNEIVSPVTTNTTDGKTEYSAKIGLMYVSDYMYAASPTYWTYSGYSSSGATSDYRAATRSNWMYKGYTEWTISPRAAVSNLAFEVSSDGYVGSYIVSSGNTFVRPSFNLSSSITYVSGSGSAADPILVN